MIKVTVDLAVTIYLVLSVIIFLLWIFFEKKGKKFFSENTNSLWICPLCFYEYIDSRNKSISQCPRCKTLHKKGEKL